MCLAYLVHLKVRRVIGGPTGVGKGIITIIGPSNIGQLLLTRLLDGVINIMGEATRIAIRIIEEMSIVLI